MTSYAEIEPARGDPLPVFLLLMSYSTSSIKRKRRTKAEMERIRAALYDVVAKNRPATVRQVFYQLVSTGVIGKTEAEYHTTVCRLLTEMRLNLEIPFDWIADNTRWMRKPDSYDSLAQALDDVKRHYRRALWSNQDAYVEVWTEKDAIAGVLYDVTGKWDVPLMVTRGYSSITFLHEAAEAIRAQGKPAHLYYFGDWDPSGLDIEVQVEGRLTEFGAVVEFERVAVTPEQISTWNLLTRPTKKTDSRARNFEGGSVEVDAIPPQQLRDLVFECIARHVDEDAFRVLRVAEQSEKEVMSRIINAQDLDSLS